MASEAVVQLIEEATDALQRGNAGLTLELADRAIGLDESISQAHQLRGIALTRLDQVEEATIAFRRATEVSPYDPKHYYNLAVNLRDRQLNEEAASMAREALRLDSGHPGARSLIEEFTGEKLPEEPNQRDPGKPVVREGYGEPKHLLPFMYGMEKAWDAIGYLILVLAVVLAVSLIFNIPMGPTGKAVAKGALPDIDLKRDTLSVFQQFLYVFSNICTFMWMLVDIVDRRRRFTWIVPIVVCGTAGFNVLPLAFYLFVGRKLESDGVSKS